VTDKDEVLRYQKETIKQVSGWLEMERRLADRLATLLNELYENPNCDIGEEGLDKIKKALENHQYIKTLRLKIYEQK